MQLLPEMHRKIYVCAFEIEFILDAEFNRKSPNKLGEIGNATFLVVYPADFFNGNSSRDGRRPNRTNEWRFIKKQKSLNVN